MNRLYAGILTIILLISPIAASAEITTDTGPIIYELSLDEAIDMAFDGNERVKANEHKQYADKISVDSAYLTRKPYKKMPVNAATNFETYCLKEGYYIEAAKMSQRLSKLEGDKIRSSVSYDVTNSYYNVVLAGKLVNAANNAYNLALENKKIVDRQYELGLIAQLDYENALLAVETASNMVSTYTMNERIAKDNLAVHLGIDGECDFILTDDIECEEYFSEVDTDIRNALESRYDITALMETRDLSYKYFELAKVLTESTAVYNKAYSSYLDAEYNYDSTKKLMAISLRSMYNNVLTQKQNMTLAEKQYNIKQKEYEAAKIKYELGSISNIELTKSINDLYDSQVSFANTKLSYKMAIEKYRYEINTGL